MTQRPKLVLGFVLALLVAGALGLLGRLLISRVPRPSWWLSVPSLSGTRYAAAIILALCVAALILSGFKLNAANLDVAGTLAVATALGALAAWFGIELAPFVTGLVIAQIMQAPLSLALKASSGDVFGALTSGSWALALLALAAVALALSWPLVAQRWASDR